MIVLTLQYHLGDRDRAADLLRLIADIEPAYAGEERNANVKLRLVARFDCPHLDLDDIKYAARKGMESAPVNTRKRGEQWHQPPITLHALVEFHPVSKFIIHESTTS